MTETNNIEQVIIGQLANMRTELAVNTTHTTNIISRLDKINGSVERHERAIADNREREQVIDKTAMVEDHEGRIRELERSKWIIIGVVGALQVAVPIAIKLFWK